MSEKVLVILETDPETGMSVSSMDHRVACAVEPHQVAHWESCRKAWEAAQEEMAAVFKKHGGRFYGEPMPESSASEEVR